MSVAETKTSIDQLAINTIRTLSMDAVQKANSGHPGTPMALAPVAYQLWQHNLRYDPAQPLWPGRDRFVLSCGHASMLLYSMLHLAGVRKVAKHENKRRRRPGDHARRHQELPPAGQPLRRPSGVRRSGRHRNDDRPAGPRRRHQRRHGDRRQVARRPLQPARLRAVRQQRLRPLQRRRPDGRHRQRSRLHRRPSEAHQPALDLRRQPITIEGHTELAFSEDVATRFEGYGWNALQVDDANDLAAIQRAIDSAKKVTDKPSIIILKSIIGYGSPNKANTHARPRRAARRGRDQAHQESSTAGRRTQSSSCRTKFASISPPASARSGKAAREAWEKKFAEYEKAYPEEAAELKTMWAGKLPEGWDKGIPTFPADAKGLASRVSSGKVLNGLAKHLPWLLGGSADLAPSTMTLLDGEKDFEASNYGGRNLHFGIREHGMAAICNGMSLCGLRPYRRDVLRLHRLLRPAMRLSAHHAPAGDLRAHARFDRPGRRRPDASAGRAPGRLPGDSRISTSFAPATPTKSPSATAPSCSGSRARRRWSSRGKTCPRSTARSSPPRPAARAAVTFWPMRPAASPTAIIIATGSELDIAVKAWEKLTAEGVQVRLVSMPCIEWFDEQDAAYRASVLPRDDHRPRRRRSRHPPMLGPLPRRRRPLRRHEHLRRQRPLRHALQALRHHARARRRRSQSRANSSK